MTMNLLWNDNTSMPTSETEDLAKNNTQDDDIFSKETESMSSDDTNQQQMAKAKAFYTRTLKMAAEIEAAKTAVVEKKTATRDSSEKHDAVAQGDAMQDSSEKVDEPKEAMKDFSEMPAEGKHEKKKVDSWV